MRKVRTKILTPYTPNACVIYKDHVLAWEGSQISYIRAYDPARDHDCEDRRNELVMPGMIDIHTHLSQYRIRGRYEPSLLEWLEKHVYPEEEKSVQNAYAKDLADEFFRGLFAAGTTTSVIYTAPYQLATELAFESAASMGARAFIGMTMMDRNSPQKLLQTTEYAFDRSRDHYERYDGYNPLLRYIFTPRFALSCSQELMEKTAQFCCDKDAWIQTHLSENPQEIASVLEMFSAGSYTEVYDKLGLLTPRTILAHAIHLSKAEMDLLSERQCRVAYCPDSNFFLKSGEFNYPAIYGRKIPVGIGSDVAAGTQLSMLYHAKQANFRQSSHTIKPERLLYHITLGNAAVLGLEDRIGSLEQGKEADLCFLRLPDQPIPDEELVSALCFTGSDFPVVETVIAGRSVYGI
jgi:guanine deaminase